MKLPDGQRAYVNMVKLRYYSLNPTHEEGKQNLPRLISCYVLHRSA